MSSPFGTDLKLVFRRSGDVDLSVAGRDIETVSGADNLAQALMMRILVDRGDLGPLGHPRYGSEVSTLIGKPLDRENLELLRRFVKVALLRDPRVESVPSVRVSARADIPGAVDVVARVKPKAAAAIQLELTLDVG